MNSSLDTDHLIHNIITIKVNQENYVLINGLYGTMDVITDEEYALISRWKAEERIIPTTQSEKELYTQLVAHNYITSPIKEDEYRNQLINKLKACHNNSISSHSAWFILSYACNFACPYCYEQGLLKGHAMTTEMIDRVFSANDYIDEIGLFGGEPLLLNNWPLISHIIEKASPESTFSLITNGYYLEEYIPLLSTLKISNIQVTLDGSRSVHNRTRHLHDGSGTYDKIMNGVKLCVDHNIPITIRMNLSVANLKDCLAEKARLQETTWGKLLRFELQPLFQSNRDEYASIFEKMLEDDSADQLGRNRIFERLSVLADYFYNGNRIHPILKACDNDGKTRFYDCEGNIYNCILAVGNQKKSIGTFYPSLTLKEKSFLTRDITKIEKCSKCEAAFLCGGGCPNALPDDVDLYSPNCYNYYQDIYYLIPHILKNKGEV